MTQTTVHIINHTHWDREWFLTSIYTSRWIPGLIDKIDQLAADNPNFKFLFDGQTLVIEDLLKIAPGYEAKVKRLIAAGHLIVGPYYCQPDWQMTGGEALIRNLLYGWRDMQRHGGQNQTGWLVDTFGHIAQAPQLHRMFGLQAVYVWRGVPEIEPYFYWQSSDGQQLLTINLFGGYRNLYGITHVPEVALKRLEAEVAKLRPYYSTPDLPLFDGYDLEQDPEDPMSFYQQDVSALPPGIQLTESAPYEFARTIQASLDDLPAISGELNSGKYGATFPGTFSARTYLKLMNHDCEQWLYRLGEPLAVLARLKGRPYRAEQYAAWSRLLLQNTVHDCLCGVSIDQVHEKMEFNYRKVFEGLQRDVQDSLAYILHDFAPGTYAVSTNPFAGESWQIIDDQLYEVQTQGLGVWPVKRTLPIEQPDEPVETLTWQNDYYTATAHPDGTIRLGSAVLGRLVVGEEQGDTYSSEAGLRQESCSISGLWVVEQKSEVHCVLRCECALTWDQVQVSAVVRLTFDQTPMVRWQIELDSRGTNFKVDLVFETAQAGQIYAGMPFDVVKRPASDTDLLPRQLDKTLSKVLLGQRELIAVKTFPFQDFVAISDGASAAVIFAKGLRAYQADEQGTISLTLRRSVEWLTAANLEHRVGDAGPFFYVPDARCERTIQHELAVMIGDVGPDDLSLHQLNAGFQNPPLLVNFQGHGSQREWQFLQEALPLSSLQLDQDKVLARFFNPTGQALSFRQLYRQTDIWGHPETTIEKVPAKGIVTVEIAQDLPESQTLTGVDVTRAGGWPVWRVGQNQGLPDPKIIEQLQTKITDLEGHLARLQEQLNRAGDPERYFLQHKYYVLERELYEFRLSVRLNELKLARQGQLTEDYLFMPDEQTAELGLQLNHLRIKRRIYDYVIEAM